jgi:hypothetical protein
MARREERSRWTTLGFFLTGLYLIGFLALKMSDPDHGGPLDALWEMPLNSLGDFLAGFFAPLAFLWLFIATMVQSQELALQRRELALTRAEFEQAREVAKAQVVESKRQAENIEAQTKLVQQQIDRRTMELADEEFVGKQRNLVDWFRTRYDYQYKFSDESDSRPSWSAGLSTEQDHALRTLLARINETGQKAKTSPDVGIRNISLGSIIEMGQRLDDLVVVLKACSPSKQVIFAESINIACDALVAIEGSIKVQAERDLAQRNAGLERRRLLDLKDAE